jgi:uncharacterized Zn finger protein
VVTPRVEADPQRYDFAKISEPIATSLVQAAQEQANRANVMLEQAQQLADHIRSQVAGRELAEMNERLMAFGDSLLAAPGRHPCIKLLEELKHKGIGKFVAFEVPLSLARERYGGHFQAVESNLHETDDLRVLDFNGQRVFQLFRFDELGAPILQERP